MRSEEIMDAVERGQAFTVTRIDTGAFQADQDTAADPLDAEFPFHKYQAAPSQGSVGTRESRLWLAVTPTGQKEAATALDRRVRP
jgi:hypothetical protein